MAELATPNVNVPHTELKAKRNPMEVVLYNRSPLIYWWPMWFFGYLFAIISQFGGVDAKVGNEVVRVYASNELGVLYIGIFLLILVVTNFSIRGTASLAAILGIAALSILFAYLGWWGQILATIGNLSVFMNAGFYFVLSTVVLTTWAISFFVSDHFESFEFTPGQLEHRKLLGGGQKSYDSNSLTVYKMQDDMFRHWILGLGTGDIHIAATNNTDQFVVRNVPFAGWYIEKIERLIAMKPDADPDDRTYIVGEPR